MILIPETLAVPTLQPTLPVTDMCTPSAQHLLG